MLKIVAALFLTITAVMAAEPPAPADAAIMPKLITKVNTLRAGLKLKGFNLLSELTVSAAQKSSAEGALDCSKLSGTTVLPVSGWDTVSAAFSIMPDPADPAKVTEAELTTQIDKDFTAAKAEVKAGGGCNDAAKCALGQALLVGGVNQISIWSTPKCTTGPDTLKDKFAIIYIVSPKTAATAANANKPGECAAGDTSVKYPADNTDGQTLCQKAAASSKATAATSMSTLIGDVNKGRAALNLDGYPMLAALTVTDADKTTLEAAFDCAKLTGMKSMAATSASKFAFSEVAGATAAPDTAALTTQIGKDFTAAKAQLDDKKACKSADACGLAEVLLARDLQTVSIWTSAKCSSKYYIIYIVSPAEKVGKDMSTAGTCASGFTNQQYPKDTKDTKLCQKKDDGGSGAASLVVSPLLLLLGVVAIALRG